jgi:hypothetical protein
VQSLEARSQCGHHLAAGKLYILNSDVSFCAIC